MPTTSILLSGYYGFDNAGDEAICASIIAAFKKSDQQLEITVLSSNPEQTKRLHQVEAISRTHLPTIWRQLQQTDLFISGGGSLLQDQTGKKTILYYLGLIKLAQLRRVPVAIFAQGIGPVHRPLFQKWIAKAFQQAAYVSVRDQASKQLLLDWGMEDEKINVGADPVFLWEKERHVGATLNSRAGDDQPTLAVQTSRTSSTSNPNLAKKAIYISIRRWPNQEQDLEQLALVADQLIMQGEQVIFLPLHYPDDLHISEEVIRRMKKKAKLLREKQTPQQIIALLSRAKLLIGMRLHALIFAAVMHTPVIAISYDPKIDALMQQLEEKFVVKTGEVKSSTILERVKQIQQNNEAFRQQLSKQTALLKEQAQQSALAIINILNSMT